MIELIAKIFGAVSRTRKSHANGNPNVQVVHELTGAWLCRSYSLFSAFLVEFLVAEAYNPRLPHYLAQRKTYDRRDYKHAKNDAENVFPGVYNAF